MIMTVAFDEHDYVGNHHHGQNDDEEGEKDNNGDEVWPQRANKRQQGPAPREPWELLHHPGQWDFDL